MTTELRMRPLRIRIPDPHADEVQRRLHHRGETAMHPFRREQRKLQLQRGRAFVIPGDERIDDMPRDLRAGRRHGCAGPAELESGEQHLHRGEIARVSRPIDLHDQAGDAGEIAGALLDELHAGQPGERDRVRNGDIGARPGIEIKRDRESGLARHGLEIGDEIGLGRWARKRTQRRQQLYSGGAKTFREMGELDRGLEGRMRNPDHDRNAAIDALDGPADQSFALLQAEIGIFLRFHSGGHHHGRAAVPHDVVDLASQCGLIDLQIRGERGHRRNDQTRHCHPFLLPEWSVSRRHVSRMRRSAKRIRNGCVIQKIYLREAAHPGHTH